MNAALDPSHDMPFGTARPEISLPTTAATVRSPAVLSADPLEVEVVQVAASAHVLFYDPAATFKAICASSTVAAPGTPARPAGGDTR